MVTIAALSLWMILSPQDDAVRELIDKARTASWQDYETLRQVREAVPKVIKLLAHEDPEVRKRAAAALGSARVTEAAHSLIPLLQDPSEDVRTSAALALGRMGSREAIPALIGLLGDPRGGRAYQPTNCLREMGAREAVPRFIELLKNGDRSDSPSYCSVLTDLGGPEAVAALRMALEEDNSSTVQFAARGLGQLGARESVPALRKLLDHPEAGVRVAAGGALLDLGAREFLPNLLKLLDHGEEQCGCYTLIPAFAALETKEAIPTLRARLKDAQASHRATAVATLGSVGARESIPEIATLLEDSSFLVQTTAARALGAMDAREHIPAIERLLAKTEEPNRRASLAACLARLGSRKSVPILLDSESNLTILNLLRRKDAWDTVSKVQFTTTATGIPLETYLTNLEKQTGMTIDWPVRALQPRCGMTRALSRYSGKTSRISAVEGLETALRYGRFEIILESGEIRIVSHDEALKFWREWYKEEQRKDNKK